MRRQEHNGKYKAVIFDMGGVLVPGPGAVFRGKLSHNDIKFPSRILSVTMLHLPVLFLGLSCIPFSLV